MKDTTRSTMARLFSGRQSGTMLLETLLAVALVGLLGATLVPALAGAVANSALIDEMVNMENLARAQMEYTKNSPYMFADPDVFTYARVDDAGNPNAVTVPDGYSISVVGHTLAGPHDDGIQLVTVTVQRGGKSFVLNGYKVAR